MNKEALWEAVKLPLRLLVLAILPFLIVYLAQFDAQWAIYATILLAFVDKYLHEYEKAKPVKQQREGVLGVKGLTGF